MICAAAIGHRYCRYGSYSAVPPDFAHIVRAIKFCKDTMIWKHLDQNLLKNGIMKKILFYHRKLPLHQKDMCGGSVKKVIRGEQRFQAEEN